MKYVRLLNFLNFTAIYKEKNAVFQALLFNISAGIVNQGVNFCLTIFIVRYLGRNYSELVMINSTNALLLIFILLGLNSSSALIIVRNKHNKNILSEIISLLYKFIILNLFILFLLISILKLYSTEVTIWDFGSDLSLYLIIFLWLIFLSLDTFQVNVLAGLSDFKSIAKSSLIKGVASILIIIPLVYMYKLIGILVGYFLINFISFIFNYYFIIRNGIKINILFFNFKWKKIKYILSFSLPLFFASLALTPINWYMNSDLYQTSEGRKAIFLYGVFSQLQVLIQFFPLQITNVMLPFLTSSRGNSKDFKKNDLIGIALSLIITIFLITTFFFLNTYIFDLYKISDTNAKNVFSIILITSLLSVINLYIGNNILAKGKIRIRIIVDFVLAFVVLTSFITLKQFIIMDFLIPISYFNGFIVAVILLVFMKYKLV